MTRPGAILLLTALLASAPAGPGAPAAEPSPSAPAPAVLSGLVLGPDRAALPGARVRLTSQDAGVDRTLETGARGLYRFEGLPPAIDYVLSVEDPDGCLRPAVQDRIALDSGGTRPENFRLDYTVAAWMTLQREGRLPVINMAEVGQRAVYDHVFIEGLPIVR